ncbi:MAG TPA: helix-turn-helix transcriptional regulator [Tepidimicrobium sp.]|nr:helix-turn-helix transcriptional regulator [Tepidimicrobium sp.]
MIDTNNRIRNFHIRKAVDYIENNYSEPLSLDDMAKYLNLNKSYLSHLFKKETAKTYSQIVNEIRIEKSKDLIINTNLSILEVALSVGYNNQNYFNMVFKKITGITPLNYRNQFAYKK